VLRFPSELEPVGEFEHSGSAFGFIYSATSMDVDISEAIEDQVRLAGGEAVVNTSVNVKQCALNFFFPLNHLPFWPGCATFHVAGTIVRRKEAR